MGESPGDQSSVREQLALLSDYINRSLFCDVMAWTWTGYDHDAVHRFKENDFFQTGRNLAEERFWKLKIHGEGENDRRGTRSTISLGGDNDTFRSGGHITVNGKHYHNKPTYSYEPRERSNSVISTFSSRMRQFGPSRDYPYSYPGDCNEEEEVEGKEEEEKKEEEEEGKEVEKEKEEEEEEKADENKFEMEVRAIIEAKKKLEAAGFKVNLDKDIDNKSESQVDEKNLKKNPVKTMIETKKNVKENHISSRFY